MKKLLTVLILLSIIALGWSSLVFANQDRIIIGTAAEAVGLDPRMETDIYSGQRIYVIMEPLVIFSTEMELAPRLATSWEFNDDGTKITFNLREGVKWHDGVPFTAEDVKYTYEWILNPENQSPNRSLYVDIIEIEIENDHLLHFHLEKPNSFLLNNLARICIVPAHHGEEADFRENPVGTGPFQFVSWSRDDRLVLSANQDYWGGAPNVDELEIRPIPEDSGRLFALEAGEIDVYQDQPIPEEIARLEEDPSINVQRIPGTGYRYLGFNTTKPPFDDVLVRRAMSHLVPREGIVDVLQEGLGIVATGPVPAGLPWYNPDVPRYDHDVDKALELFTEAGIDLDEAVFNLYSHEDPAFIRIAEIIQFEASRIGLTIRTHVEEWGAYWSRLQTPDHPYEMYLVDWFGQVDPDRAMYRQYHTDGARNFGMFSNEELDYLLEKGQTVPPASEESISIYNQAQEIVADQAYYAFIHYYEEVGLSKASLNGFTPNPFVSMTWANAHLFYKE